MRVAALTFVAVLAIAAAGCGGRRGGRGAPTTPPTPKLSAYANALEGLCARRLAALEAIGNPTSPDELEKLLPKQLVVLKRFSADSKALRASDGGGEGEEGLRPVLRDLSRRADLRGSRP